MKQRQPCPGCGGKPARWYVRAGRSIRVHASIVLGGFDWIYPDQGGWHHTTDNCPVLASARTDVLKKKERR